MPTDPSTAAIVLAAGGGSRFAGATHKLLAELPSPGGGTERVIERVVRVAADAAIGPVVVVAGAVELTSVVAQLDVDGERPTVVTNARWQHGQATSLAIGLDAARRLGVGAAVVGLGDQPGVTASAWRTVAGGGSPITVATYDGVRGNPVRLTAEVWRLLPTEGDVGARTLMDVRPDLVGEVACEGSAVDIDSAEDLDRWQNS